MTKTPKDIMYPQPNVRERFVASARLWLFFLTNNYQCLTWRQKQDLANDTARAQPHLQWFAARDHLYYYTPGVKEGKRAILSRGKARTQ